MIASSFEIKGKSEVKFVWIMENGCDDKMEWFIPFPSHMLRLLL